MVAVVVTALQLAVEEEAEVMDLLPEAPVVAMEVQPREAEAVVAVDTKRPESSFVDASRASQKLRTKYRYHRKFESEIDLPILH